MKKKMTILYIVNIAVIIIFLLFTCVACKTDVFRQRETKGYELLTEVEVQQVEAAGAPLGVNEECILQFDEITTEGNSLMFYSHHQYVAVYIGDELVYQMQPSKDNPFGKTPGSLWNEVPIYRDDVGKEIRVVLSPVYDNVKDSVPEFYFGKQFDVWAMLIGKNVLPFIFSLTAVVLGILFIVFVLYNYRNSGVDKSLMMMGFFAVGIGTWKITDMDGLGILFPYEQWVIYMPYLALMLEVIPFALFVKELFSLKEHWIWYVVCFMSLAVNGISLLLQVLGIVDLREMLSVNHMVMLILVFLVAFMLVYELKHKGWNDKLKIMLICLGACLAGLALDIVAYYISDGVSMMILGMVGFLVYIIVLGIRSVKEMKELMEIGMEAKHYEQMAYHDELTGLYNRTAYAAFTKKADFTPEKCIVVMCDLNNLKKCNDTYGHEKGDRYIVQSAKLIWRAFGDLGKCYRMGGDEFCALLSGASVSECEERLQKLKKAVEDCNRKSPEEFPIQIACGYERFDDRLDYDLNDTLRRADKMMYHEKFIMKQAKKEESGQHIR